MGGNFSFLVHSTSVRDVTRMIIMMPAALFTYLKIDWSEHEQRSAGLGANFSFLQGEHQTESRRKREKSTYLVHSTSVNDFGGLV